MTFEMTDHVSGLSDPEFERLVDEAETGYDLTDSAEGPNPHLVVVPESVIRQALVAYLNLA